MEKDRTTMVFDHIVPLLKHHQHLSHYYIAARFINYTLADSGTWSGKWKLPMTECAMRPQHMPWEDSRVSRWVIQYNKEEDGWVTHHQNLGEGMAALCYRQLLVNMGYRRFL
jgi:hypothetical protein